MTRHIRLKGASPGLGGKTWESTRLLRIGRSPDLEIALTDASLSRRHAEIVYTDHQGWSVRDVGSTNGTFLNGIRVGQVERKLEDRDVLQFGNVVLVVAELHQNLSEPPDPMDENLEVQASTKHSWEEALELLALDLTRQSIPGEQLMTLLRAGQQLYQVASLDDLLRMTLRDAVKALRAQRGAILLADAATGKLVPHAVYSDQDEPCDNAVFSRTLVERCFRRGESLLCNDVRTDPELLRAKSVTDGAMASVLCVLLRTPRKPLGVLHLDRGPFDDPFTTQDLHLADGFAAGMSASVASSQMIHEKQRNVFIQTVIALAQTLELRDPYTSGHANRVTDYALLMAEALRLPSADRQALQIATPLHDIGKIGLADAILQKEDGLSPEEFEQLKEHPVKGAALLQSIPDLAPYVPIIRGHHERWDGKGYPDGLAGEQIPFLARVIAVADAFDVLTYESSYRVGLPLYLALEQIEDGSGTQFDPRCVRALLDSRTRLEQQFEQRTRVRARAPRPEVVCVG